jgi:hypothetical protein
MDEVSIEEQINNLRPTLVGIVDENGNQILDNNVIEQIIALLQMLNRADAEAWRFDQCDAFVAKLTSDFTTDRLEPDQLRAVMAAMAEAGNAENIDPTQLNVERVRRGILYLLLAGVTFAALQTIFPGFLSFILESAYALFLDLKSNGIADEIIIAEITTNSSPFSAGPFFNAAARASMNLINAAFNVCADAASICGKAASQAASQAASRAIGQIPDCLKYAAELLAFALATKVAKPVVDGSGRAASAASGSQDAAIATWIRNGGPANFRAAMGENAAAFANAAINKTKKVIREAIEGMNDVYYNIQHPDERIPPRHAAINVNDTIIYWLQEYVSQFQRATGAALTRLMTELSTIDFEHGEETKQASIDRVAQTLMLGNLYDQRFIELLTAYTLAVDKQPIQRSVSLRTEYRPDSLKVTDTDTGRSASQSLEVPSGTNPYETRHELKAYPLNPIGPDRLFPDMGIESQINLNRRLETDLINVGITKETRFPPSGPFANKLVQNVVGMYSPHDQKSLITIIEKTVTVLPKSNTKVSIQKIKEENNIRYLAAIEKFLKDKNPTKLGGRRRRKSRRYKKKRSTLKRRRIRRRSTRKGRKRRHTKRR